MADAKAEEPKGGPLLPMLKRISLKGRDNYRNDCATALDYADGNQVPDVTQQLHQRFRRQQTSASAGQRMQPVAVPIVKRFIAEQANAYSRGVQRQLVDDGGNLKQTETDAYNRMCDDAMLDEYLHAHERRVVNLEDCGLWPQLNNAGTGIWPAVIQPCDIYPVPHEGVGGFERADADEYAGHVIDLGEADQSGLRNFALHTPQDTALYRARGPKEEPEGAGTREPNDYGMNMLTVWQKQLNPGKLLALHLPPIVHCNREINVLLSVLEHTIRWQSYGVPVLGLQGGANSARALRAYGMSNPLVLNTLAGETADMLQASPTFDAQMGVIARLIAILAVAERVSPDDVSSDGGGASFASGFAKLVASMPKLEAREDRLVRLTAMEERKLGPRLIAIGVKHLELPSSCEGLRLRVSFEQIRFPESQDERSKRYETDLKHGFTTATKILADERGMSLEDAKKELEENLAENAAKQPAQQPGQTGEPRDGGDLLSRVVGRARNNVIELRSRKPVDPEAEKVPAPGQQPAAKKTPAASDAEEAETLNGAQVTALKELLTDVAAGLLPRESALELMQVAFNLDVDQANKIMGRVGKGFAPKKDAAG